jgi:hypothetical protein
VSLRRGGRRSLKSAAAGWDSPLSLVGGGDGGERAIREIEERERGRRTTRGGAGVEPKVERGVSLLVLPRTAADGCRLDGIDPYGAI